ncbi:GPI ethanolamine phosphate transferase 2 isoform X4 [Budorcas taxicolor]|uniref:GPI ethanolamine phosphate transferase 2 isoform X4 n=1 Tax=Budorcas taxicolor TaxID=37181 RepID=UPI0022848414|nr:GPI ethanolamine phosphate transferase 2 isoform X4 [Budorcas taxicolor]
MRLGSGTFAAGCVVIEVLGVALFLRGFFPAPVFSGAERQAESPAPEPSAGATSNWTELPPPLFSKVVIMLIDALRDDFVFGSKGVKFMPYTTYLVEKGSSLSFVAEAKPPTVTMPRIKALLTGSLPGFIDVVRNLNSPTLLEDNVITRAKAAGKRIIFYGDETWVKLFPKHFVEYDGTTSFFVSDYTEVDNNVTRHLDKVLKRQDWDVLILHYLGLDHIGHISGPSSPLIGPKLSEMDSILMKIHTSLLSEEREALLPSLLALCGDHGMSEAGGHGASSMEEVNTALVLISSAFERKPGDVRHPTHVQQTDLAATLSIGLGLPIPKSNTGSLMFRVVERRPMREQLRFLHLNTVQLSKLLQENVPSYTKEPGFEQFKVSERLHRNWVRLHLEENNSEEALFNLGAKVRRQYLDALRMLRLSLTRRAAQYDVYSMAVGTVLVLEALALLLLGVPQALSSKAELDVPLLSPVSSLLFGLLLLALAALHVVVCTAADSSCYLCGLPWLAAGGVMALTAALLCAGMSALTRIFAGGQCLTQTPPQSTSRWSELDLLSFLGTVGHVLSLGASSFIEEEHQTCSDHKAELSVLAAVSLTMIFVLVQKRCSLTSKVAMAFGLLGIYCYRAAIGNVLFPWQQDNKDISKGITEARFVYVFVLGILFTGTKDLLKSQIIAADFTARTVGLWEIHSGLVLLAALLLRPHNLPVLVLSLVVQTVMTQFIWRPLRHGAAAVTVMHYWFGQAFFYFQGNSNSIATVDISAGFVGLDAYMEIPAMFLTAFATYSGPVLWASHLVNFLTSEASSGSALRRACFCYALVCSAPASVYILMVTSLRYHLFIWSVFSPKLLYEGTHLLATAAVCIFFTAVDQTNTKA